MTSSTPTKTPATSSVQDDGSKEKPNDHRGVTTLPHYAQHDPGKILLIGNTTCL